MSLSFDLISEFVKITNDKKERPKEGTVYATVVSGTGGKYVKIDGSDLLTPMETTTDIEDGERVTLMIKDHKAIVTGNVTNPSASTGKMDRVNDTINSVSERVGTFELVIADKVSTKELEAYKATVEVLIAGKATIEDLTATNAKVENLEVKNAQIENLVAEKANITDLNAVNATIENLKVKDAEIEHAVVENLKATTADINILNADFAQIKTLVNGNLTSDNILSFNLTSEKVTVDDAFIKDAMIDTISAGKINAGKINTNSVSIGSEDGGMLITGSTQQFTDKNGNVRIQIGKDASGDFTFVLYGEDGTGQIINQNGITASAIGDGLIVNNMVSDNAAIAGGKLDISSVITEINGDTSTTIKSSKIYLNEQQQSLEVAFNSLKTKVDTIQEITVEGDLTAIVEQVRSNTTKIEANTESISTLISEDTIIKKQVTDLEGTLNETETTLTSQYTSLNQSLEGFKTTVADTYATKSSVTDVVDNLSANYSTTSTMNSAIEQKAQEISASVSSTYATKNEVNTLDNNLRTNYSTTQQMESAINVAKEEINLGVSSVYETKENSTSKIQNAVNDIQVGGRNLLVGSDDGYLNDLIVHDSPSDLTSTMVDGWRRFNITTQLENKEIVHERYFVPSDLGVYTFSIECRTDATSFEISGISLFTSRFGHFHIPTKTIKISNNHYKITSTFDLAKSPTGYTLGAPIRMVDLQGVKTVGATYLEFRYPKVEKGNIASDWSQASEDITSDISTAKQEAITSANNTLTSTISNYYTKSQTDSQINVAKEEINLGVSSTYETKEVVESKTNTALNNAKSYADTKKSEAISTASEDATSKANTAKNDAIASANNTLNTTIANYYTKTETDSQINVAKDAINLGVSSTYETKTEATNKMNNAIFEARHVMDTRNTNETPHWYMSNYPSQTVTEFKQAGTIGLPENGISYYTMTTTVPWNDNSGGRPTQVARTSISEQTYERVGISDTEWSAWLKIENASSAERRVSSAKEEMRSEINVAKDAVTTTVSNLRTEVMSASYNNLLWNSDFLTWENDFPKGYYSTNRTYCFGGGWICPEGGKTININTSAGGVNWQGFQSSLVKVRQDQTLTASVYVAIDNDAYRGTVNFGIEILWLMEDGSRIAQSGNFFTIDTVYNWERHSVTGTAPEGTVYAQVYCWHETTGVSWWGKPMLQFGSVMTAWTRGGDLERVDERLSYAEQKITDDAITNTVRQNFYTKQETENSITSKGYATSSQVQQTADSLTATFTKSGGCNLFRNSGFKCPGDAFRHWYVWNHMGLVNSGNFEINRASDDWGFPSHATDSMVIHVVNPTNGTNVEYGRGQTIDTTAGQTYTVSCYYALHRVTSADIVVRNGDGHWLAMQGLDINKIGGNGGLANWGRATLTFTATGNRHSIEFMLHGVTGDGNAYMWIAQPMCNEGSVAQPYSAHPNEAYDGVIMMDYDGIKVSATGFGGYTHMTKDGFYLNNGSTDVFYVNGDGLKIGSNPSTSINGDVIRSGNIVANNGDLTFNLNSGQMYYKYTYNQVGFLGVTDGNAFSLSTDAKGWCMNSDYGSFSSMGAKSVNGGNYVPYLTVTSGGVSNYNAGIFLSMPLNYGSATGTNMTVKNALELSTKVDGAGLFNPKIAWRGTDVVTGASLFPRSYGDRIDIYTIGSSVTSSIYLRLADDVDTYFNITCNHCTYGHQSIASFRYVTDINGYGIDFYRGLNMHNYNLGNVALKNAKSVQTASLALLDDVATVQTASPTAMYALDNGIEATQATITQHIATSINKTVTFNGTELVEGTSEYIELPQDFLMCVDIQVTLTPNKLCRFAVTSKDEFGFVIETDTEGVTFDYVVIGTKMDGTLFASLHNVEPDIKPVIDDEEEYVPCTTDNLMLPQELIDKGYTTFADATEEEMEAMKFEQVFGSPVEEVTEDEDNVTEEEVTEDKVVEEEVIEDEVTEETQEDIIIENEDDLNGIDTGTIIENY